MSATFQSNNEIEVVGDWWIEQLKRKALNSADKRARLLLHWSPDEPVTEMVIALHKFSDIRPHRHPQHKSESYHVIEGTLGVSIFEDDGRQHMFLKLDERKPLYRMRGGWFHQPIALTEWCIFHEVYTGPFVKDHDVEYADWDRRAA